jgi:5-methylcytosine-specific restriction endonuclease McrA
MSVTPRKDRYQLMAAGYQMAPARELCGSTRHLVIDHIIPLPHGGSNELENLRTLCSSCNTKEAWKWKERVKLPKYTTYLRPATIKWVKRYAFEHELEVGLGSL